MIGNRLPFAISPSRSATVQPCSTACAWRLRARFLFTNEASSDAIVGGARELDPRLKLRNVQVGERLPARRLSLGNTEIGKLGDRWLRPATIGIPSLLALASFRHLDQQLTGPALCPHASLGRLHDQVRVLGLLGIGLQRDRLVAEGFNLIDSVIFGQRMARVIVENKRAGFRLNGGAGHLGRGAVRGRLPSQP